MDDHRTNIPLADDQHQQCIPDVIKFVLNEVLDEVKDEIIREARIPKRLWVRKWISRRNEYGASTTLFHELAEDKNEYFSALQMSEESFNYLLSKVEHEIQKRDTVMRSALESKLK